MPPAVIDDNRKPDGRIVGDADCPSRSAVTGWITGVPGGVGPVTVAIPRRTAVTAARWQKSHYGRAFGPEGFAA